VEHAVISGAGKQFLVALLSLDLQKFSERARQANLKITAYDDTIPTEYIELIKSDVLKEVTDLQNYLHPAGLILTFEPFTIDGGELTANLKVRRKLIAEKYQGNITSLYEDIGQRNQVQKSGHSRIKEMVVHCL
jgi:long-chain acyl-CoA synthetase